MRCHFVLVDESGHHIILAVFFFEEAVRLPEEFFFLVFRQTFWKGYYPRTKHIHIFSVLHLDFAQPLIENVNLLPLFGSKIVVQMRSALVDVLRWVFCSPVKMLQNMPHTCPRKLLVICHFEHLLSQSIIVPFGTICNKNKNGGASYTISAK